MTLDFELLDKVCDLLDVKPEIINNKKFRLCQQPCATHKNV